MADKVQITVGFEGHYREMEVTRPAGEPAPWDAKSKLAIVGGRTPRLDGPAKVTGKAKYTYDLNLPGMLHARVLRANVASGKLESIDLSAAKKLAGVRATWAEKAGKRVLFAGQEIAAVCATTPEIAEEAITLIKATYATLPWVVDAAKAREPGAPEVFPPSGASLPEADEEDWPGAKTKHEGNVRTTIQSDPKDADIDKAFAEAEVVVEGTYRTQVQTHSALETHGSIAKWEGDSLTLWTSTQATFGVRDQIAQALKLPKDKVRVLCEYMGGGFGAKFGAGHWSVIAARLAKEAGAPVKLMLSRREEHLVGGNRPDSVQWLKIGAKKDGTLVAMHLKSFGTPGVGTGAGTGGPVRGIYKLKAWKTEEADVFTNTGAAQPFRAPGHPQGCFALEQAIDELAQKLGMDPIALRRKNLANPVQIAELERAAGRIPARGKAGNGRFRRGVGLACGVWYKIVNKGTQVQIDIHRDGRVEVKNGAQDIGTGTRTYMATVAAEELGIPLDLVTVQIGDTNLPYGPGSGGSTTTPSLSPAARSAAFQAKQKLYDMVDPKRALSWKQATARIPGEKLSVIATRAPEGEGAIDKVGGVQAAEVEVDTRTGRVKVLKVHVIQDFGRVLNRMTSESQINGGVIQGVSYALFENRVMDRNNGRMVNTDLEQYKIAFAGDIPEIAIDLFETSPGFSNTGAIGLGEPPTVPTAAAIANAVHDAIGVRIRELPITPDKVLAALGATGGAK